MKKLIFCIVLLSGCATPAERLARLGAHCEALGFQRDTEAFANCQLQTWSGLEANRAAAARAIYQQNMQNMQQSRPITCTRFGNTTTCN